MKYPKELVKVIDSPSIDLLNTFVKDYVDSRVVGGFRIVSCVFARHGSAGCEEYTVTLHMRKD